MFRNKIFLIFLINALSMWNFTEGKRLTARSTNELQRTLTEAVHGDTIQLSPMDYQGDFALSSTDPSSIIKIRGADGTRIFGNNTALKVTNGTWHLRNLTIASGDVGIHLKGSRIHVRSVSILNTRSGVVLEGDDHRLESLTVNGASFGVLIKGSRNLVKSCTFTGMTSYGIMVESGEQNNIESNTITTSPSGRAKGILLEKQSSSTRMISNTITGLLSEIKGNSNELRSETMTGGVNVFGCQNTFISCTMDKVYMTSQCGNDMTVSNTIGQFVDNPMG